MYEVDEQELKNSRLSEAERREKKEGYMELIKEVQDLEDKSTILDSTRTVVHVLNVADKLGDKVYDPHIILLDANLMSASSEVLKKNVEAVDVNIEAFKPEKFSEAILLHVGNRQLPEGRKWKSLLEFVHRGFKVSQTPAFMCNNIDLSAVIPSPKPKMRRTRVVVVAEAQVKRPENVKTVEKQEDSIEESVLHILQIIRSECKKNGNKPLCFFSLVVNPNSFSKTVENIFHFSFLVKDRMVDFHLDNNGDPCVLPTDQTEPCQQNSSHQERSQAILSMNMLQWEEIKKLYNIKTAMITPISK